MSTGQKAGQGRAGKQEGIRPQAGGDMKRTHPSASASPRFQQGLPTDCSHSPYPGSSQPNSSSPFSPPLQAETSGSPSHFTVGSWYWREVRLLAAGGGRAASPLSPGSSRRPRNGRSSGEVWRNCSYAGYRGPKGLKKPPSLGLHPRWLPAGVRARQIQKGRS